MAKRTHPPRGRLQPHQIAEIRRLKKAGCTQMEIKRITGISRTTIHKILTEHHPANDAPQPVEIDEVIRYFDGPIERCPRCGRKVHMPCMPCRIDSMTQAGKLPNSKIQADDRRQIAARW